MALTKTQFKDGLASVSSSAASFSEQHVTLLTDLKARAEAVADDLEALAAAAPIAACSNEAKVSAQNLRATFIRMAGNVIAANEAAKAEAAPEEEAPVE